MEVKSEEKTTEPASMIGSASLWSRLTLNAFVPKLSSPETLVPTDFGSISATHDYAANRVIWEQRVPLSIMAILKAYPADFTFAIGSLLGM
jgi:hypothetical protein